MGAVGSGEILYRSCSVSIIVRAFLSLAQSCGICYRAGVCLEVSV